MLSALLKAVMLILQLSIMQEKKGINFCSHVCSAILLLLRHPPARQETGQESSQQAGHERAFG